MADAPRKEFEMTLTTVEKGRMKVQMFDRITVDDVLLHLAQREIVRVVSGVDYGVDVPTAYKDFLVKERYTTGQR